MNTNYLFLYTIGPVQSFIARARKTHDLWSGSSLLSELSRETALYAKNVYNAIPVFPPVDANKKFMPNRFLAFIEAEDISKVGKKLEKYTLGILQQRADEALKNVNVKPFGFDEQIENFLQIHWAALPCKENQYPDKFSEIEQLLAAVKNVRAFNPLLEKPGRKCSLSGEQIALFYDAQRKPKGIVSHAVPVNGFKLNPGEALDGIGFIKRCFQAEKPFKSFPSTAEIALGDTIHKFPNPELLSDYKKLYEGYSFDAQLFFEENLTKKYFEKYSIKVNPDDAKIFLKKIREKAAAENLVFQKYYAVVMLDGDNVGAWLSGEKLKSAQKANLQTYHEDVSKKLTEYATFVQSIFNNVPGKGALVYCGGDDVLAFVNLNHLISVLKDLREKLPDLDGTGRYTATAGVVVAHYKTPLSEVLKWVRKVEKEAKNFDSDKNKIAFAVLKHSGEIEKFVMPWHLLDRTSVLDVFQQLQSAWKEELLSASFVRQLLLSFYRLLDSEGNFIHKNLLLVELERLIKRSALEKGKSGEGKEKINTLIKLLNQLLNDTQRLKNFMSFLSIADFLERKVK